MSASDQLIREDERGRCAALVRSAGCSCKISIFGTLIDVFAIVGQHGPRCPESLADKILEQK